MSENDEKHCEPRQHGAQTDEADLAVAQPQRAFEHLAPGRGAEKGQQAFEHRISAKAPITQSIMAGGEGLQRLGAATGAAAEPPPRMALKKSLEGSITITSLLLRKLAR